MHFHEVTYICCRYVLEKLHDLPTHKIPKDVESVKVRHLAASVDVSSSYRFTQLVWVGKYGQDVICRSNSTLADLHIGTMKTQCSLCRSAVFRSNMNPKTHIIPLMQVHYMVILFVVVYPLT